jgi:hypothetical protein
MRSLLSLLAVVSLCCFVTAANADTYGWEDGVGTILGFYGNLANPTNVGAPEPVHSGERALRVTEDPVGGTPQAYIAWITGLTDGDTVDASFWGLDDTPDVSPSLRIWAHYSTSDDIENYQGSAGGNETYTSGIGWEEIGWSWTFDSAVGTRDALVIEARLYTGADPTDYYIDDVTATTSSSTAAIIFAPEPASLVLLGLGGLALLRRR